MKPTKEYSIVAIGFSHRRKKECPLFSTRLSATSLSDAERKGLDEARAFESKRCKENKENHDLTSINIYELKKTVLFE